MVNSAYKTNFNTCTFIPGLFDFENISFYKAFEIYERNFRSSEDPYSDALVSDGGEDPEEDVVLEDPVEQDPEEEDSEETVSDNETEETVSDNETKESVSDNTVSDNSASENTVSENYTLVTVNNNYDLDFEYEYLQTTNELLTIIGGCLLFVALTFILKYIYKFFRIFF